jgi:transaldolase
VAWHIHPSRCLLETTRFACRAGLSKLGGKNQGACVADPLTRTHTLSHKHPSSHQTHNNTQIAIERAVQKHRGDPGAALDAATVGVGALFAKKVSGRVSTEVDPRLAHDTEALVSKAQALAAAYKELGVDVPSKILFRIPATWEGIAAAGKLEAAGLRTHVTNIGCLAQAAAACQAGVAVIQPSVAALGDWFRAFPNAIRNPRGPREDAGTLGGSAAAASNLSPGVDLVARIWCYARRFAPGTAVMASGVRTREEARALSGVDYLVAGPKVLAALAAKPTTAGYNDGLSGGASAADDGPALTPARAAVEAFDEADTVPVTKQLFEEGLGAAGRDVLEGGVKKLQADVERVLPAMAALVVGGV